MRHANDPAEAIQELLTRTQTPIREAAERAGLDVDTLNREVRDRVEPVSFLTAALISEAFDTDLLDLVYGGA